MFYPAASLTDNCCNLNVEIVHNLSRHISWYVPDIPSYIVLQICQGLGIIVTDPFLEVPLEEVVTWFQVMGVGWPREVGVTQNEFITWKISAKRSKDLSEQWGGAPSCWWITVFISTPIFLPVSCERRCVDFLENSSRRFHKFWILPGIMAEQCRPLWHMWSSATLPFSQNLATKRWIVLLSGTLFIPRSFLHCCCARKTGFVAKYTLMIGNWKHDFRHFWRCLLKKKMDK